MQNFFEQVKVLLAGNITSFSPEPPNCVYVELKYREKNVEMDYNSGSLGGKVIPGTTGATFVLSIDCGTDFELEILPKNFFDRLFDVQAGVSPFDGSNKFKVKIPLIEDELVIHTNNEGLAKNFLSLPDVSQVVRDYGINFFKIDNGELKVYLDVLPAGQYEELKSSPALIKKYLDIAVDLSAHINPDNV